jgi:uncharacterized membrane protein (UPF0182 family)
VAPIYLQSDQGRIPELKRVIVAYNDQIEMKPTLDEALLAIFNPSGIPDSTLAQPVNILPNSVQTTLSVKAREALEHYNKALDYLKQDNWAGYGRELEQLKAILSEMSK